MVVNVAYATRYKTWYVFTRVIVAVEKIQEYFLYTWCWMLKHEGRGRACRRRREVPCTILASAIVQRHYKNKKSGKKKQPAVASLRLTILFRCAIYMKRRV